VTEASHIIFGYHPVREALRAGRRRLTKFYLSKERASARRDDLVRLANEAAIPIEWSNGHHLSNLCASSYHQGICAESTPYPFSSVEEILTAALAAGTVPLVLVLDHLVDPQNFGAVVRTAQCVGAHGVIVPKDRSAPPSATVSKASAGALEHIRLARVANLVVTLKMLKKQGFWVAGTDRDGDTDLFHADLRVPLALVIGGEEKGIRPLVRQNCDLILAIPQTGPIGSLNASVAAAIVMYEILRQRTIR
jgi:23S rRNA (guanosine2251-2'-O)-methyltransferase